MSDENSDRPALDRDSPQVMYQDMPSYYHSHDIPHVLARIRAFDRFFHEVVDQHFRDVYQDLHIAYIEMMERELQPYAFDLALSLIALEDSLADEDESDR